MGMAYWTPNSEHALYRTVPVPYGTVRYGSERGVGWPHVHYTGAVACSIGAYGTVRYVPHRPLLLLTWNGSVELIWAIQL